MKTRFVKAAVWMLVVSLLAVAVSFTVAAADTPVSEFTANWSLSASAQTVTLDGVNSQTVTVSLVTNKTGVYCDGIAGRWDTQTASGKIKMSNTGLVINESIVKTGNTDEALNTPNYAYPIVGEFMWVNSILAPVGNFGANFAIVTATYVIDPKTPTGTYVINFTKTVYAGAADVSETEETLSIAIQVNGHTCTPSDWMCDVANTKHWKECTVCHEIINNTEMEHGGGTANCQTAAICTTCKLPYGDVNPTVHAATETQRSETEHWEVCKACHVEVTNSRYGHQYTLMGDTQCACGAVKPVTNVTVVAKGAITHTVEGQVVTVTHTAACKVGYLKDGKYVTTDIVKTKISDNCYSFTVPEGVTEVLLVVKGDVNGNGSVNVLDKNALGKSLLPSTNGNYKALTEDWQIFAADVNGMSGVNILDKNALGKSLLPPSNANYKALTW